MTKKERAGLMKALENLARFVPVAIAGRDLNNTNVLVTEDEWTEALSLLASFGFGPSGRPDRRVPT